MFYWVVNEFTMDSNGGGGVGQGKETEVEKRTFYQIENLHKIAVDFLPCCKPTGILDG